MEVKHRNFCQSPKMTETDNAKISGISDFTLALFLINIIYVEVVEGLVEHSDAVV